jgi:diguanylate cyclase (GGDEF)-like protein
MSSWTAQTLTDALPSPVDEPMPVVPPKALDRAQREALLARLADNPQLPSPPGVVLQVLERASQLDCTPADLAAVIHRDPALCGKILKAVNSALYGLPRPTTSIDRAVALLGFKLVRSVVLSLSLPAVQRQQAGQPPMETFWKESVAGAIVAHELARHLHRPNAEDDLVAGLLRDLGVLALQQVRPADYARFLALPLADRMRRPCQLEEQVLGLHHAEVSAFLLRRWRLPEDITEAIRYHHAPEQAVGLPRPVVERARLLAFASRIAQLQTGAGGPELLCDILVSAREHYGMCEAELMAFLEPLAGKIEDFAALMNIDIGACEHYPLILGRAAEELVKLTVESSVDKLHILEQKRRAEQETQRWREQAHRLRHEVARDTLTGAFNRGCFEEELARAFRRARRRGTVLGLIFLDLDDFKSINDCFGHLFGDRVLRETADNLFAAVRHGDIVARFGGDEFCILVENTSPANLQAMAERLCQTLNNRIIRDEAHKTVVHASIGAVLCSPRTYRFSVAELLTAADKAMYAAKSVGKNQVRLQSLLSDADVRFHRAVEDRLFSVWLSRRGVWETPQPDASVRRAGSRFEAPGRLSRRLGWLTAVQLRPILREQHVTRRSFDEIALERGALTAGQVQTLLALRLEPPEDLAANLVSRGVAGELVMQDNLRRYSQWLRSLIGERPA